jgi:hypothetical protein
MVSDKDAFAEQAGVKVSRSDLIYVQRSIDVALSELLAAVADGDVKEEVAFDLERSLEIVEEYLS